jgi:hypothetical protein
MLFRQKRCAVLRRKHQMVVEARERIRHDVIVPRRRWRAWRFSVEWNAVCPLDCMTVDLHAW